MFKIKASNGTNNLCGKNLKALRKKQKLSQRQLALKLQVLGYDFDNYAIRRIENGERFVTDIEINIFCQFFDVTYEDLIGTLKTER